MKRQLDQGLAGLMGGAAILVLCGLLVSPAAAVPTIDTTSQGSWVGVYGADGYILNAFDGTSGGGSTVGDRASLPSYISSYSYSANTAGHIWNASTPELRAVQDPANPLGPRRATTRFAGGTYSVNLVLNTPKHFQLGVYGLDYDSDARAANVTVNSETVLFNNPDPLTNGPGDFYRNGIWGLWDLNLPAGPFTIQIQQLAGANAVISAITFDEIVEIPEPASIAAWLLMGAVGVAIVWRRRRE